MLDKVMAQKLDAQSLRDIIQVQAGIAALGPDLGNVMNYIAEHAQRLTGADGAVVELAEGTDMVYRAATGFAASQLGLRLSRDSSLTGLCVKTGEVLACEDSETDPRVNREACRKVGIRSMVVVPLIHDNTAVGVLKVASGAASRFGDSDRELLDLMTGMIAASIAQAQKHENSNLYHRATHDALTGLANRALFYDRLRQGLALVSRKATKLGLLILDLDGLKPINDQCGHRAGDAVLRETATRIQSVSRESDTTARLGGDEFGIILNALDEKSSAEAHAARLTDAIEKPFQFEGRDLTLAASIGAAIFPEDGGNIEDLIEQADRAMYQVKRLRKTMGKPQLA